jgi:hypothetical protein
VEGFWASLFGSGPEYEHETSVYDHSLEAGSTVVTVRASAQQLTQILDILERHHPVDIDERAASYLGGQTTTTGATDTSMATGTAAASAAASTRSRDA